MARAEPWDLLLICVLVVILKFDRCAKQGAALSTVFSNDTLFRNLERFLTTFRLSMIYDAFFKQCGFVYNLKFGGDTFESMIFQNGLKYVETRKECFLLLIM